jgi:hypothetical protein
MQGPKVESRLLGSRATLQPGLNLGNRGPVSGSRVSPAYPLFMVAPLPWARLGAEGGGQSRRLRMALERMTVRSPAQCQHRPLSHWPICF